MFPRRLTLAIFVVVFVLSSATGLIAQKRFTIEQILSPAYPFELISAKKADRIAWIAYDRGMRNVYTAVAPDFKPVRLTEFMKDDGIDLSGLEISDDGSLILFVRGHNANRDGWIANPTSDPAGAERAAWAIRTSGGAPWKVIVTNSAVLSPDGKWAAFAKEGAIYRVPADPKKASSGVDKGEEPLFRVHMGASNPSWSPDSRRIAFGSDRRDHSYVGVYDTVSNRITYLAAGVDRDTAPTWSQDNRQVAFIRRPGLPFGLQTQGTPQGRGGGGGGGGGRGGQGGGQRGPAIPGLTEAAFAGGHTLSVWIADAETGIGKEVWRNQPKDTAFDTISNLTWAGNHLIFGATPEDWDHYYSIPVAGGGQPIDLTPGEGFAEVVGLSADGRSLFYATNVDDIDRRHIWKTPVSGGTPVRITSGDAIETYPVSLPTSDRVAVLMASSKLPLSVGVVTGTGKPQVVFPSLGADFPLEDQVVPQNVTLTADDGLQFHNQLFLPRDLRPGEKRPAMLFTHGGPQRQMLLGYHYRHFYHMAYAINQYFANQGYIVISVNYRSGIGYGEKFRTAQNRGQQGNSEYQDVLAAGRYLQKHPNVDPQRIGLWGLSYGGILTAQGLARNSDIFSAGVDIAGVHLWGSSIDPNTVSYKASSISEISKWKSPVLLIHGDDDRNVAFSQTTGLVQLLRANNVYHELIVFPDDVHDSLLFNRWLIAFRAADDFFQRFIIRKGSSQ